MEKKPKKPILRVGSIELVIGNTYEIIPKIDYDAPKGYQEHGTTKLLMPGISEIRGINFDEEMHLWDTGFDIDSPVNAKLERGSKEATVKLYNTHIRIPFEKRFKKDLDSTNNEFWDDYLYELHTYKMFDTFKEKDLLDLFMILQNGRACQVGEKDATLQRTANYCVRSREKEISLKEERGNTKFKAYTTFGTLLNSDLKKDDTLYTVLEWIGVANVRNSAKDALQSVVVRMLEDDKNGYEFSKRFMDAYKETDTEIGKEKMEIFSILQQLKTKNKLDYKRRQYYIGDVNIGNHLKEAAEVSMKNPDLKKLIIDTYDDSMK